jgi:hypothetical protein
MLCFAASGRSRPVSGWTKVAMLSAVAVALSAGEPVPLPPGPGAPGAAQEPGATPQPVIENLPDGRVRVGGITVDPKARTVSFAATLNDGLIDTILEVIIATPKGRLHEALLWADISPLALQSCLYLLNLNNGPRLTDSTGRQGDLLDLDVEYNAADGKTVREPVEAWIRDTRTGKRLQRIGWVFTGSRMQDGRFLAEEEGNICIDFSAASSVLDSPDPQATDDTIHVVDTSRTDPKPGARVRVIITARGKTP